MPKQKIVIRPKHTPKQWAELAHLAVDVKSFVGVMNQAHAVLSEAEYLEFLSWMLRIPNEQLSPGPG